LFAHTPGSPPSLLTFRKQAGLPIQRMPSEKPSIAEVIVALNQLDAVAFA
jgi:hypothetical protein